jgi:hypothetical protein
MSSIFNADQLINEYDFASWKDMTEYKVVYRKVRMSHQALMLDAAKGQTEGRERHLLHFDLVHQAKEIAARLPEGVVKGIEESIDKAFVFSQPELTEEQKLMVKSLTKLGYTRESAVAYVVQKANGIGTAANVLSVEHN